LPARLCESAWSVARAAGQLSSRPLCAARRLYLPDACRASNAPSTAASLVCRARVVPAVARGDGPWPAKESPREAGTARNEVFQGELWILSVSTGAGESSLVHRLERGLPAMAPRASSPNGEVGPLVEDHGPGPLPDKEGGSRPGRVGGESDGRGRAGGAGPCSEERITTRCS
jgi:hypothetical protein